MKKERILFAGLICFALVFGAALVSCNLGGDDLGGSVGLNLYNPGGGGALTVFLSPDDTGDFIVIDTGNNSFLVMGGVGPYTITIDDPSVASWTWVSAGPDMIKVTVKAEGVGLAVITITDSATNDNDVYVAVAYLTP